MWLKVHQVVRVNGELLLAMGMLVAPNVKWVLALQSALHWCPG